MKELLEYREKMIDRLAETTQEFCSVCRSRPEPFAPSVDGWNIHQIASHTREVDRWVYGERIQRTLDTDNPEFKSFDADAWMSVHYKKEEALEDILRDFSDSIERLCGTLRSLPEQAWSRVSRHEMMGGELTLQFWVERCLAHVEEHLHPLKNG